MPLLALRQWRGSLSPISSIAPFRARDFAQRNASVSRCAGTALNRISCPIVLLKTPSDNIHIDAAASAQSTKRLSWVLLLMGALLGRWIGPGSSRSQLELWRNSASRISPPWRRRAQAEMSLNRSIIATIKKPAVALYGGRGQCPTIRHCLTPGDWAVNMRGVHGQRAKRGGGSP